MTYTTVLRVQARGLIVGAFLALVTAGHAAAQNAGAIEGSVVSDANGAPIADVDVFLEGSGRRALTNRTGRFKFLELRPGSYTVVAERVGFGTARQQVSVQAGQSQDVTFRLEDKAVSIPEVVVVASRRAKDLSEVAASVGVIGGTAIRETHPTHPSEVMSQVPGVWVNVTGGEGHMTAIRQPLSTSPVYQYLEDGVPTRSTGFFNHNALYEINLPQADRVEVMKGPANAMYGSDAIGGVVNVGTRAPSEEPTGEFSFEGGQYGFQQYLGSLSGSKGSNGLRLDGNFTRTNGWRAGTDYKRYSGTGRWDVSAGSGASLKTIVAYSNIDQNTAGSSAISETDYMSNPTTNYTPISYRKVTALRISSAFEKQAGAWTLSLTPYARNNSMELLPNWALTYDPTVYKTENKSAGLLAKASYDVPNANANITAGVDVDYSPGSDIEWAISATKDGSVYDSYTKGATLYDYAVTFHGVSPWVQTEYTPVDRLHLSAGVRADFLGYDYTNHLGEETAGSHRRPADSAPTFSAVSPKFGVTVAASNHLDLFASYRRGLRAPSQGQLFRQGSATNTVGLEPVKADSWETGFRGDVDQRFRYDVSLYYMTMKDDILGYQLPDGTRLSVNAGKTLHKGVEVGLGAEVVRGLSFDVAFSYAEHTYEDWSPDSTINYSGNEQESAPRQIGSARVNIAPPSLQGSLLTLEWSRVGSYFTDQANEHKYDGHDLFNVRAQYDVNRRVGVYAKLNNLFDKRYAERVSYNAFRGQEYAPGLPRTIYLGLSVK